MKSPLDDPRTYKQLDTFDIYQSLSKVGRQIESGWQDVQFANIGIDFDNIQNIVFAGMGGSSLPAKIVRSIAPLILAHPFEIVENYRLPAYASKSTLVILCSYSGNTEETLSCAQDASRRGCLVLSLTTGGKLKDYSISEHIPMVILDDKFNPCKIPRSGIGITTGALISLLIRINQKAYTHFDIKDISHLIEKSVDTLSQNRPFSENPAKNLAQKHKDQGILVFSANHLDGVSQVATNFIQESAKAFAVHFSIPDLNHHLLEGMEHPLSMKDNTSVIILNSSLYPEIIQKRVQITKEILLKQKYHVTVIKPESDDLVLQVFESLVFLIMFSYYLSITNKVNPGNNLWVDHFKAKLTL